MYIIIIASYVGEFSGPVPFQVPFPLPDLANIAGGITLFQKVMSNCSKIVRPGPDIPVMIGV